MKMRLARTSYTPSGTWGILHDDKELPVCVTLENPWIDNVPRVSCIPLGLYQCIRVDSPKFGVTFQVAGVHERTHILFHKGNTEFDTSGCILLGSRFGQLSDVPAILESNPAFRLFMGLHATEDNFELAIVDAVGGVPYQA